MILVCQATQEAQLITIIVMCIAGSCLTMKFNFITMGKANLLFAGLNGAANGFNTGAYRCNPTVQSEIVEL